MKINRRIVLAGALAMPAIARAQTVRTMKLTLADTVASPVFPICQRFAANLKAKSNGTLDVQVYGAGQLGSQTNALTSLQTGIVDFVLHTTGYMETIFPKVAVLDLPYVFRDAAAAEKVLDGPVGEELFKPFPERGIYGLCWGHWGWRPISTTSPQPANKPADMSGVKIRIQPGAIYAETYRLIGAVPTAIDISEVYLALVAGRRAGRGAALHLHGRQQTPGSDQAHRRDQLRLQRRRADGQQAPLRHVHRRNNRRRSAPARRRCRSTGVLSVATATDTAKEKCRASGVSISAVDLPAYIAATKPIYAKFRDIIGGDLIDQVLKQTGAA